MQLSIIPFEFYPGLANTSKRRVIGQNVWPGNALEILAEARTQTVKMTSVAGITVGQVSQGLGFNTNMLKRSKSPVARRAHRLSKPRVDR